MADPIIKLENVNLWYDQGKPSEVQALKNINLEINRGEYTAFFGPSGSGKTTLLYLIAGIDQPQEGKIIVNNRDITKSSKRELAIYRQIGVGIIFQQFNLIPSLSVANNVALPMAFLGTAENKRQEESLKLLDRLGIKNLADRYPFELSGGQQQRVGIARALANNPPIIVADEPLGNLDSTNAQIVLEFLKELNEKDGRTVIMVTHEAWSLRDVKKIFFITDGTIKKVELQNTETKTIDPLSEKFYKELAPAKSGNEAIAYPLSNLLMRGYTAEEIKRFEFFLNQRLVNKIDAQEFALILDQPYREGGIGLWKQKAQKISRYIENIIAEKTQITEIYKELEKNPATPLRDEIERIRIWLLEEYKGKLSATQIQRLNEIIIERLRSIINSDNFKAVICLSKNKFGVGLSFRAGQKIAEKLELILTGETILPPSKL